MLEYLSISSLGVIGAADLEFHPGFTAVTGETGAGKTMVVTAMNLILGARADPGIIRHGADRSTVDAGYHLPETHDAVNVTENAGGTVDPHGDGSVSLVVTRSVIASASGGARSRASSGGRSVPIALLQELGEKSVAIHGQTDQLRLKSATAQREALDAFGGEHLAEVLRDYRTTYEAWSKAERELREIIDHAQDRAREAENLQRALDEIDEAAPEADEENTIRAQIKRLENMEGLRTAANAASQALSGDAEDLDAPNAESMVEQARQVLAQESEHDSDLEDSARRVTEAGILLADISADLSKFLSTLDDDAVGELNRAQSRLAELKRLMKLYGPELSDVIAFAAEHRPRLEELVSDNHTIDELSSEVEELNRAVLEKAQELSELREAAAGRLGELVTEELRQLSMPHASFQAAVTKNEQPGPDGQDNIALMLIPHSGSEPRPLGKGASGGELSRVMLALEVVLADTDPVPTFVFDEVDAGVGGEAAVQIGQRLAKLAQNVQVIVVTHLPQVAAFADHHLRVLKETDESEEFTTSDVKALDREGRIEELARMLAGRSDSESAREHAEELLDYSKLG